MKEMLTNYISRYSAFGLKMEVQKRDKTGFSIIGQQLPILRPGDDVRNEITHGGHRLVPLVGCAAIVFKCSPDQVAFDKEIGVAYRLGPLHIPAGNRGFFRMLFERRTLPYLFISPTL